MAERPIEEIASEVLRLDQAATPGPWEAEADAIFDRSGDGVCEVRAWSSTAWRRTRVTDEANASLIATYRTAAPELAREVQRLQAAAEDRERQHKAALDTLRMERDHARMRVDRDCARLADEVAALVRLKVIDERSPAADALLDWREPPSSPRADRLAVLEGEVQRLRAELKSRALDERDGAFIDRATKLTEERDDARARVNELLQEQDRRWDCRAPEYGPPCGACTSCLVREREALEQEVGQLRTTLQGAEVLCNALKAQAAGREGS